MSKVSEVAGGSAMLRLAGLRMFPEKVQSSSCLSRGLKGVSGGGTYGLSFLLVVCARACVVSMSRGNCVYGGSFLSIFPFETRSLGNGCPADETCLFPLLLTKEGRRNKIPWPKRQSETNSRVSGVCAVSTLARVDCPERLPCAGCLECLGRAQRLDHLQCLGCAETADDQKSSQHPQQPKCLGGPRGMTCLGLLERLECLK